MLNVCHVLVVTNNDKDPSTSKKDKNNNLSNAFFRPGNSLHQKMQSK